jgi:8-oxo-dGTP diphosphatase
VSDSRLIRDNASVPRADDAAAPAGGEPQPWVPRIPASAGALIFDSGGRLLLLKPTYKKGWTIPGGQVEASGESPWEACRRETREECGLEIDRARLVCVDFLRPKQDRSGGVRFLFHCGAFSDQDLGSLVLQEGEIRGHRLVHLGEAIGLLRDRVSRRVSAAVGADRCVYLEEGRPVPGVTA